MTDFASLTERRQVKRLRAAALEVCREFGIEPVRLRLLAHAFNTTFRVDTADGRKFALRMNVNSQSSLGQIRAEVEWVEALRGRVGLAQPMRTPDGGFVVSKEGILARPVHCVLYTWLGGRLAAKAATPQTLFLLGQAMGEMHRHAASWEIPAECRFRPLPDLLYGEPYALPTGGALERVLARGAEVFARLAMRPRIPVHYDLHLFNAKVCRGRVYVFDFDDAVLAWPAADLAVSLFYLRGYPDAEELEAKFRLGAGVDLAEEGVTEEELEVLVACRGIFLANAMTGMINPKLAAQKDRYLDVTERRIAAFEATGRFDPRVATL
ncbi:MAG TPA: phosphotransferase [Fimbriimonadaceae bacterium]|nr:phosphotransferase [Fimbriimonadaceae bacterium]